jgi:hypothetical protein
MLVFRDQPAVENDIRAAERKLVTA